MSEADQIEAMAQRELDGMEQAHAMEVGLLQSRIKRLEVECERTTALREQAIRQCERIRGWWHDAVRRRGHSWEVVVLASGGWVCLATFATEADAWEWGARQMDARVSRDGELIAEGTADSNLRMRWRKPGSGEPVAPDSRGALLRAVVAGLERRGTPQYMIDLLNKRRLSP